MNKHYTKPTVKAVKAEGENQDIFGKDKEVKHKSSKSMHEEERKKRTGRQRSLPGQSVRMERRGWLIPERISASPQKVITLFRYINL